MAPGPERLRVGVDASPLVEHRTGVGQFTAALVAGLATRGDVEVVGYAVSRRGRDQLARNLPSAARAATSWVPARVAHATWSFVPRPRIEHWTGRVDVVHATNFVAPPARAPVVVTVHDLTFLLAPELCRPDARRLGTRLRRALARGATVHAVSDHVAMLVREHFGVPSDRVVRVYEGAAPMLRRGDPACGRALAGADRYVLTLGTVEPRKNLPRLVRAFDAVSSSHPSLNLVVAGPDGWGVDAFESARAAASASPRVRRLGYVTEEQRGDLLAGAAVLAYPSLDEGFGHPPLEAMAAGVPVVAARAGALPEVLGDAALLVDPTNEEALANALSAVLDDQTLRVALVQRGRDRVRAFPWSATIDGLVALYRRVARG